MTDTEAKTLFGDLYEFNNSGGNVIPLTSGVKEKVVSAFQTLFGQDFGTDPETPAGRMIEAVTYLFKDVCGVNAQNASRINPDEAVGDYLDRIGLLFGVERGEDESDTMFRKRILSSISRGSGFAASIANAIGRVANTSQIIVLDNGLEDPAMLPIDGNGKAYEHAISVDPHSVFISVLGGVDADIVKAIRKTKSAGCGFSTPEGVAMTTVTVAADAGGPAFTATFCKPTKLEVSVYVEVVASAYNGDDIAADTQAAVKAYLAANSTCVTITENDIVTCVAKAGKNIVVRSAVFFNEDVGEEFDTLVVKPYQYIDVGTNDIEVEVA